MAHVEFLGERFEVAERVGLMPLMRFAKVAKAGVDSDSLDGLTAMYDLLEQCIADREWERFQAHADKRRADGEQLMEVVSQAVAVIAERPTQRPSDSSAGPSTIEPRSTDDSSSRVINRFEQQGRPDLALLTEKVSRARSA